MSDFKMKIVFIYVLHYDLHTIFFYIQGSNLKYLVTHVIWQVT